MPQSPFSKKKKKKLCVFPSQSLEVASISRVVLIFTGREESFTKAGCSLDRLQVGKDKGFSRTALSM